MELATHYPLIRALHIALAAASVSLFCVRAAGVQAGAAWPMAAAVRRASVLVDVALLTAGGTLWWLLQLRPDRDPWLLAKLMLLVVYIVLGSLALKRARTAAGRRLALAGALASVAAIVSIALAHDAWAPLRGLGLVG